MNDTATWRDNTGLTDEQTAQLAAGIHQTEDTLLTVVLSVSAVRARAVHAARKSNLRRQPTGRVRLDLSAPSRRPC